MQRSSTGGMLYDTDQRRRRDSSPWTIVQGVLAPIQFLVFLISLALVVRFCVSGNGFAAAADSVVLKTVVLYAIMITGAIWEREVFGRWLFAPAFFWEDVVSIVVLVLHTAYVYALFSNRLSPDGLMALALAAYATYCINAAQYILKFRLARLSAPAIA